MNIRQTIKSRVINPIRTIPLIANYWLNNYKEVIWLIGDGRSGTTWVSNLINHNKSYREMFEPFHPRLVRGMNFLLLQQYIRPRDSNKQLEIIASDVFSGKFMNPRVDSGNRSFLYRGLLIKDIFANLFSCWVSSNFPKVKIILLIRNPFSVALSKYKLKNWLWLTEPIDLLKQSALYEDYLRPFEDLIRRTSKEGDYVLCQILIWSIINYVPLIQFNRGQIHVMFYEDVFTKPGDEISKMFRFVRPGIESHSINLDRESVNRPSRFAGPESNLLRGTSPVTSWKDELTFQQIDAGLKILQCFGFAELYDDNSIPNWQVLNNIHKKHNKTLQQIASR